jgi:hypothetical protein
VIYELKLLFESIRRVSWDNCFKVDIFCRKGCSKIMSKHLDNSDDDNDDDGDGDDDDNKNNNK